MAISTQNAIIDAKRRMEVALADEVPITVTKDVLKRLVRAIEEPRPVAEVPVADLEKLVKSYGVALLAHDRAGLEHCGSVWPLLLWVRGMVEDAARKMVKG